MCAAIHDGNLLQRIETLRQEIDTETGFILPPVRVRASIQLDANEYRILVHECEFGSSKRSAM
jgi:flagellar biosynthesis protein FlhA